MSKSICRHCGGTIIFRYIEGVKTPIHLSGNCRELNDNFSISRNTQQDDFCYATSCPKCQDIVYFIRHNGGSLWVDELGWPWPKHACFIKHESSKETFPEFSHIRKIDPGATLGITNQVIPLYTRGETVIRITLQHKEIIDAIVNVITASPLRVGELVTVSKTRQKLFHPKTGFYKIVLFRSNKSDSLSR